MNEYSIFKPTSSRRIFLDYPELRKIKQFKVLKEYDMLFVWYFACECSPFFKIKSQRDRTEKCLEASYLKGGSKKITRDQVDKYLAGEFPAKIQEAIKEMEKFKVGPRIQALMITQKNFDNLKKILDIDADDASHFKNKDDEVDFAKKKSFVDTMAKAQDIMPKLVQQLEGRFNLTEDKSEEGSLFDGEKLIDTYHENEE